MKRRDGCGGGEQAGEKVEGETLLPMPLFPKKKKQQPKNNCSYQNRDGQYTVVAHFLIMTIAALRRPRRASTRTGKNKEKKSSHGTLI